MNVNSIINYCKSLNFGQLQDFAGNNYLKVYKYIEQRHDGKKANTLLIGTIFTCIAVDGKLTDNEWNFIAQFIGGYSYDEAFKVASEFYNDEAVRVTKDLYAIFPSDIKEAYVNLCIAVLCVDGRVESAESSFLYQLI